MNIIRNCKVFAQFFYRDWYVYSRQLGQFLGNYSIIYPLTFAFSFGYLEAHILFPSQSTYIGTSIFAGNLLLMILLFTYKLTIPLLYDLEGDRYINYQMTLLSPKIILVEKIIFSSFFSFISLCPLFPITKLFLGDHLYTLNTSWGYLFLVLYFACFFLSTYSIFIACYIKNINSISRMWKRINLPLLFFGGFLIPWYVMNEYSPIIGTISLFNPFLYVTEGMRQAILNNENFFSISISVSGIIGASLLFILAAFYYFKKRVDYV